MTKLNREKQIRKDVTAFYNGIAHEWSQTRRNWWDSLSFVKKYIKDGDSLLDFGCGNGRLLEFINGEELDVKYTGVDISEGLVEVARSRYGKENFSTIKNEGKTTFKKDEFNFIMSIAVFHHFTPSMADKALREMNRILKKEGVIVITAWHLWNKKRIPFLLKSWARLNFSRLADLPFSYSNKKDGQKTFWRACYWWNKRGLERLVRKNGFEVLESGHNRDKENNKRNVYLVVRKLK